MWCNFEATSVNDETINSGFCTSDLFKITSNVPATKNPTVHSIVHKNRICLAIDKNLFLLQDENIGECGSISFGANIDAMIISQSGDLIICALADGNVHGVYIKAIPVFNVTIGYGSVGETRTFIGIEQINNDYYLMCVSGDLYRISNIDETELSDITHNVSTNQCDMTLLSNVTIQQVCRIKSIDKLKSFGCMENNSELIFIAGGKYDLNFSINNIETKVEIPQEMDHFKRLICTEKAIFGLSTTGILMLICPYTKLIYPLTNEKDFLIDEISTIVQPNADEIQLLLLTKSIKTKGKYLKIMEYPSMNVTFDLAIDTNFWLVHQYESTMNTYYLHGDECNSQFIQQIEMKVISETFPPERLQKLILHGRLEEAEDFALQFNLCVGPIYESKVKRLLITIGCIAQTDLQMLEEKFEELLNLAKLIKNSDFLLTLRNFDIPVRSIKKRFLTFLINNLDFKNHQEEYKEIKEQLQRFETLELIDPNDCNWDWQAFIHHTKLINVVSTMLKKDVDVACLIWKHHSCHIVPQLNVTNIINLLNGISSTTTPFNVIQWLKHFIPCVLQTHPQTMSFLVDWSIQKMKSLEYSNQWPEFGLEFCNNIFSIFFDVRYLLSDPHRQYDVNISKLQSIVNVLQDLSVLKKNYNLLLTLDDYINDSIEVTAFQILQRVNLNCLKKMANEFLYPIFIEKGLTPVNAIIKYIHFLIQNRDSIGVWQNRAVASIELLYNEVDRLTCALDVLKVAPVPWSDALNPLLHLKSSNHPLAIDIHYEYVLQKTKIMKIKYGWPANAPSNSLLLSKRICKLNLPELVDDLKTLMTSDAKQTKQIMYNAAFQLAGNGCIERSIQFLNSLNEDECQYCCKRMVNLVSQMIDSSDELENHIDNIIELLQNIKEKIDEKSKELFDDFMRVRILRNNFNMSNIKLLELSDSRRKPEYLHDGIQAIINSLSVSCLVAKSWNSILMLSNALNCDILLTTLELLKLVNNIHFSCSICKLVLDLVTVTKYNAEFMIDLAVLLIVQQMDFKDNESISIPMSYPIAYRLLREILNFSKIYLLEVNELLSWTQIVYSFYTLKDIEDYFADENHDLSPEIIDKILKQLKEIPAVKTPTTKRRESMSVFEQAADSNRHVHPQNDPEPIIKCLSMALRVMCTHNSNHIFDRVRTYQNEICEMFDDIKLEFFLSLESLMKMKQYSVAFAIVQKILSHQKSMEICIISEQFRRALDKKLLKHLLAQKEPDFMDAQLILASDSNPEECLNDLFNEIKSGEMKINCLILQEINDEITGNLDKLCEARENRIKYQYYIRLCKNDASLKTDINFHSLDDVMKELSNKILDVSFIKKMCSDFNWDYQSALASQIIAILKTQELEFDIKTNPFGREEIVIKTTVDKMIECCKPYVNEITNTNLLVVKLEEFMETINFYFYELYLCIWEIMNSLNAVPDDKILWKSILSFLKHKMTIKRRNGIGQAEKDWWLKSQSEIGVVPRIGKYRFPFKLIVQESLKNTLDDEVCIENCDQWFPLIKLHGDMTGIRDPLEIIASQDYFCMTAVKNSISEYKKYEKDGELWNLHPQNNAFLQSILYLIKQMNDLSKILFILYFVTNHAPDGADQVEAAYECYKFALAHQNELMQNKKASEIIVKIKRKYPIYKTQHLLHLHGLDNDKLCQFVENPSELINALYLHSLVLNPQKPDINKITQEIAQLHGLNYTEIQMNMLKKWLEFSVGNNSIDLDETCFDLNMSIKVEEDFINDESVIRAHYILSSWDSKRAIEFLLSLFFPVDGPINTGKQLQAFECFVKLIDDSNSSYLQIIPQEQYIQLKCIHYLKYFGFNFTHDKFEAYDKVAILKKIWEHHSSNSKALELITYICVGYDIFLPQIWNGVLKQMIALNMIKQLSTLIEILTTKENLMQIDGLAMAWEHLIRAPFKSANRTKSFEQENLLGKSLFLLQSCPLVRKINLLDLAENCVRLDRCHMAAITIAFAQPDDKQKIIELINKSKTSNLKLEILELEELGIYSFVIKAVINELGL